MAGNKLSQFGALFLLLGLASSGIACRQASALASEVEIPTATVKEADLQLKVLTTGSLRTKESRMIAAPPIAGGTLQIIKLARFGSQVQKGEVLLAFDRASRNTTWRKIAVTSCKRSRKSLKPKRTPRCKPRKIRPRC